MKIQIHNSEGKVVGETALEPKIFEVKIKPEVVHQVMVAMMANARVVMADTKARSDVRGGGRKPWKQKGTGRARQGSIRSPQWKGGGVVFGPHKNRNFSQKVNVKMKRLALFMTLSDRARNEKVIVLDQVALDQPKTKTMVNLMKTLGLTTGRVMMVLPKKHEAIQKSVRNLPKVEVRPANSLNVLDILKHQRLVFTTEALTALNQVYLKK